LARSTVVKIDDRQERRVRWNDARDGTMSGAARCSKRIFRLVTSNPAAPESASLGQVFDGACYMSRLLVIEDEFFVAAHIENILSDDGHEVIGPVGTLDEARALARSEELDGALLDINLDDGRIDDVADILADRHIPFMFVTASARENLPAAYRESVVVHKPFADLDLIREVRRLTQ
jgi:CheY-like chemotaxis protein